MNNLKMACIDITYNCNFRCKHCYNSSGEHVRSKREMSDEEIIRIVKELIGLGVETICICGGEPMLRKNLIYIIADLTKNNTKEIALSMVTNGYLITEEDAKKLAASGMNQIQISIDGRYAESHDWLRNKVGSFDRAINAIKMLKDYGMKVVTSFSPTAHNYLEFGNMVDYMFEIGVCRVRTQPLMVLGRCREYLKQDLLSNDQYMKLRFLINHKTKQYYKEKNFSIEWGDPLAHLYNLVDTTNPLESITISAYGDLLVSPYLPISFGNISNTSIIEYIEAGLSEVWQLPIMKSIVGHITSVDDMDVSKIGLPEIFVSDIIEVDLLKDNWKTVQNETIKKLNRLEDMEANGNNTSGRI